jgi:hypothetical protein
MAQIAQPIERLLVQATHEVQLLAALTPVDAREERARLTQAVQDRRPATPRWSYPPPAAALGELVRALDAAERELEAATSPLERLALARIRELSLEAALCGAAGTDRVGDLARQRFARADAGVEREVTALCATWLAEAPTQQEGLRIASDADDARSLLSRMRAAVGERRLPFAVVTRAALAPLAATGERVILIATGRLLSDEDARRTVLHEVEGHAMPRARAAGATLVLFRAGTAGGCDDQEGRALLLEQRAGYLGPARRRQLAARHRAVEAMLDGAAFGDVTRMLVDAHGLDATEAVLVAERAFRGSDGLRPGLGRERVYLEALVRVRKHLAARPEDEEVLACGQVAVGACEVLRSYVTESSAARPPA